MVFGIAAAFAGPIADTVQAVVVAETGFNDASGINSDAVVNGVPYLDGAAPDATGQGMGESGWTGDWERPTGTGPAMTDSNNSYEGDLALHSTLDTVNHSVWRRSFTPQTSGIVKSSARVYLDDMGTQAFTFYLDGEGDTQYGSVVSIDDDGSLDIIGGNGHGTTVVDPDVLSPGTLFEDTWILFETEADMSTQTFTVSINGSPVPGSWYFRFTKILDGDPIDNLDTFRFQNSKTQESYVDDIHISHEDSFSGLIVTRRLGETTGNVTLVNTTGAPIDILGYSITSAEEDLDQTEWIPITGNYDVDGSGEVDSNDSWTILTSAGVYTDLSESQLLPGDGGTLANGAMIDLGNVWVQNPTEDLEFQLLLADGNVTTLPVVFEGGTDSAFVRSDLNFDGNISAADFALYADGLLTTLPSESATLRYQAGDLDGDGDNDFDDFDIFKTDYDAFNGEGAFAAMIAGVPEPSSIVLLLLGLLAVCWKRRRHACGLLAMIAVLGLATLEDAQAQELIVETGFNDASGINANGTANSPYENGTSPEGQGIGEPRWRSTWIDAPNRTGTGVIQSTSIFEGDQALQLEGDRVPSDADAVFYRQFPQRSSGTMNVQYRFNIDTWLDTSANGSTLIYMQEIGSLATVSTPIGPNIRINDDGSLDAIGAGEGGAHLLDVYSSFDFVEDTWYQIELDIDLDAQTYRILVDGNDVGSDFNFRQAVSQIGRIQIWQDATLGYYDDLSISGTPLEELDQIQLGVNPLTGRMQLTNKFGSSYSWDAYTITSDADSLDPVNWDSLEEQGYDETGPNPGQGWEEAGGSNSGLLSEVFLGESTLNPGESVGLGKAYLDSPGDANIRFEYRDPATKLLIEGFVDYVVPGDMNDDGNLTEADVPLFVQALVNRAAYDAAYPGVNADFVGDFDGNGVLDTGDIADFSDAVANAATASSTAVPEPTTCVLLGVALIGVICLGRRGRDAECL